MIDKLLPHALPCLIILTLSILIIIGLRRAKKETVAITGKVSSNRSSLVSLLLISLLYIVSTVPYVSVFGYINQIVYSGGVTSYTKQQMTILYMAGMFTAAISMMNYSFNFLIYSFTLKIYRDELKSLFLIVCSLSKRPKNDIA
jgi:hypothetical protein